MADPRHTAIIGGGAVGLYLALALRRNGVDCRVYEHCREIRSHSRSIGVHPVSLEILDRFGLAGRLIDMGVKIKKGQAYVGQKKAGEIDFGHCPPPWRFVLSLPQSQTERLLEEELEQRYPGTLKRGVTCTSISPDKDSVSLSLSTPDGEREITACRVVGCDGKESSVRSLAGIGIKSRRYPDCYLMGEFPDTTRYGSAAVIWLHRDGLVESFPLPDGWRRWVIRTRGYLPTPDTPDLLKRVEKRTGIRLPEGKLRMLSSFGTYRQLADRLVSGRIVLAGDAAHVISPIGGQGMNLGWAGAERLSSLLADLDPDDPGSVVLEHYSKRMRSISIQAARRAEFNMRLGRKQKLPLARELTVKILTSHPFNPFMAKLFTMRGLGRWII